MLEKELDGERLGFCLRIAEPECWWRVMDRDEVEKDWRKPRAVPDVNTANRVNRADREDDLVSESGFDQQISRLSFISSLLDIESAKWAGNSDTYPRLVTAPSGGEPVMSRLLGGCQEFDVGWRVVWRRESAR